MPETTMNNTKTINLALLAGIATIAALQPAMALDAQAFADRLVAVYEPLGYELELGDAKLKGDTIVIDGVRIGIRGTPNFSPAAFETQLTFNGVTELGDGGYMAQSLTVPDFEMDIEEDVPGHVSLTNIVMEDIYLPGGDDVGFPALLQLYGSFSTGRLSVTRAGAEVISVESMQVANVFNPAQGTDALVDIASTLALNGIAVDLSTVKDENAEAGATIEGLGLTNITGDITQSMSWTMADGRMVVDEFLLDFDELGSLNILLDVAGLTPEMMDKIQTAQLAMLEQGADPASEEAQAAQMMMGMQMAQDVTITSASVRYDDASIAGRLLDFFAAQQGIERPQLVEGLKVMLPQMLAGTGVPALSDLVVQPVSTFLDDPRSLEVDVAPPSPTSLLVLAAAAANPAGLISALGLAITANQAAE
jgi:hypothetical protein